MRISSALLHQAQAVLKPKYTARFSVEFWPFFLKLLSTSYRLINYSVLILIQSSYHIFFAMTTLG